METLNEASEELRKAYTEVPGVVSLKRIAISNRFFDLLAPVMNEIHGKNYSLRFWKIVMSDYVNASVSIMHLMEKREIKGSIPLLPLNSHYIPTFKQKIIARLPAVIKHYKTYGNLRSINKVLAGNDHVNMGLPDMEAVRKDAGCALPLYYPIYPGNGNTKKRELVNKIATRYTDLLQYNLVKRLPQVYVEYFDKDFNGIDLVNPASKTIHSHGLPLYHSSLVIAKYIEHGAKLYCYQHGAYYGEMREHNAHIFESSVADEFRSWGWKIRSNDVPWKAYRLEKFKLAYDSFANTGAYDVLMCYPDLDHINVIFCKEVTDHFLANINGNCKKIMARPRPLNKLFSHAKNLSFIKDSRVTIDSGLSNMAEMVSSSKLVIQLIVPGTNFLECLYVDHPTVGILQNDQPTNVVKPYYDFLLEKGVLHTGYESLVDHLNKVNLHEWWASVIKEPMYQQFKNEFLRKA